MEQQQQTPKTAYIDLRALNNAFVHTPTTPASGDDPNAGND